MTDALAVTWWGHSSTTVELGDVRIGTDPLLVKRLLHLRRASVIPPSAASVLDLVLISHMHGDHLHLPSLRLIDPAAPIMVPKGSAHMLRSLVGRTIVEVSPGDSLTLAGVDVEVLTAHHDGRRHPLAGRGAPALGFRVDDGLHSFWYPGDSGPDPRMQDVRPVDLALVPIGGWGPTLGDEHMGPEDAVVAVERVGASWAVPVHHGTFWPLGLRAVHRANHERLFVTPGPRFVAGMQASPATTIPLLPAHGERTVLVEDVP